jgi:hypothetical protein
VEALRYLGNFHKDRGDLVKAQVFAQRLLDFSGTDQEEAKRLLLEIDRLSSQLQ